MKENPALNGKVFSSLQSSDSPAGKGRRGVQGVSEQSLAAPTRDQALSKWPLFLHD